MCLSEGNAGAAVIASFWREWLAGNHETKWVKEAVFRVCRILRRAKIDASFGRTSVKKLSAEGQRRPPDPWPGDPLL